MSPELKRRMSIFRNRTAAMISLVLVLMLGVASLFSECITNSRPMVGKIQGKIIFPAYIDYNWEDVGQEGAGVVDYREVKKDFEWALWPLLDWDPYEDDKELELLISPPSQKHLMGTDTAGRDVFARLLYGARVSYLFAFSVWILTYLVGTTFGLIQGYFGGRLDLIGQRVVEIFASTPEFYLLLLLITLLTPSIWLLIPLASVFGWVGISQYMRAEALRNRNHVYCEAAISLGASKLRVLFKHVLPNSLIPIVTFSPFVIVGGITGLAGLDLLGFGVPAPTPSWGELLDQAQKNFQNAWWLALFPSLFLFLSVVCLNLIGEGLRAAFDPRA
jgi:microcin C transport system permease protein